MVVKEEIQRFCQTTSVKGIPRAAKADHKGIRITWAVAVILMVTLATYQVTSLVVEYLGYPSYTVTNEKVFDPVSDKPVLPSLTVCNENPFSSLKPSASTYGLPTLEQYYSLVDQMTQCPGCDVTSLQSMALMKKLMKTTNAYYQNVSPHSEVVSHDQTDLILSCKEMILLGLKFVERDCSTELINITLSRDSDYFNCYRVTLPNDYDMDHWGLISGVSLVLYLDNTNIVDIVSRVNRTQSDYTKPVSRYGATVVATHEEGSAFPSLDGIQIPAGVSAKVQLAMEKQYRLEPPWGHCEHSTVQGYEAMKMCISECFQLNIRRHCNCTDTRMVQHEETGETPYCLKVSASQPSQPAINYLCATDYLKVDPVVECLHDCPLTCQEFGYQTETSYSKWPSPASMTSFYTDYIQGRRHEGYFTVVKEFIEGNCSSDMDCMVKYMTSQRLIEDNFLEVKVHLSDVRYYSIQEKPKIGVADFCSKLGGILNLWAGITVVLILELVEVGARILFFHCTSKKNKTSIHSCVPEVSEKPPLPSSKHQNSHSSQNDAKRCLEIDTNSKTENSERMFKRVNPPRF